MTLKRSSKSNRVKAELKETGINIEERPEKVNDHSEFDHWKIDTVIGKKLKFNEFYLL